MDKAENKKVPGLSTKTSRVINLQTGQRPEAYSKIHN